MTANLEQLPRVLNIIYMMYNTISHPYLQQGQDIYNSCNQLSVSDVTTARDSTSPNFKTLPPINLKQSTTHIPVKLVSHQIRFLQTFQILKLQIHWQQ